MKKIIKVNGKKYKAINEDINSSGYSQLKRPLQGATIAIKIINRALKQQNDDKLISEIEYLFDKAEEMMDILKNPKYKN